MTQPSQFCTFFLDRLLFGIQLKDVQEVIREIQATVVPLAPEVVTGLMNLRGQVVTAIDLRRKLELGPRPHQASPMSVVVCFDEGAVSLLVDEIGDVVEVEGSTFELPPETLRSDLRGMILGVHKLPERLLHVLDTAKVCQIGEASARSS